MRRDGEVMSCYCECPIKVAAINNPEEKMICSNCGNEIELFKDKDVGRSARRNK